MNVCRELKKLAMEASDAPPSQYKQGYLDALSEAQEIVEEVDCECAIQCETEEGF